jgi:OFA family oxalate/formate antiporter-like MFS transporter
MEDNKSKVFGWSVVLASWLAVFCLFGYRATFAILKGPMAITMGWSASEVTLGYSLMMVFYAITAYFSGMILDKWGTKPVYTIAAIFGGLGFVLTSRIDVHLAYLFTFGLLGGIATGMLWVTSTVSVRKWYIGKSYATMWGFAFAGAPMAQFVLAQIVKPKLGAAQKGLNDAVGMAAGLGNLPPKEMAAAVAKNLKDPAIAGLETVRAAIQNLDAAWRGEMMVLGIIVFVALFVAVLVAKKSPENYGMKPFGAMPTPPGGAASSEYVWGVKEAFSKYAIWAAILTFLSSMMAEFLIWTQVVSYWTQDVGLSLKDATDTYAIIGLIGIFSMPLMGIVADRVVKKVGLEAKGRKIMLIIGPLTGVLACIFLLMSKQSMVFAYIACFIFAVYWAIVPGGVVGYTGAVYGRKTLGKIWGLATLIVMGIGPFTGTFIGAALKDWSGNYTFSIYFAFASFVLSILLASTLPLKAEPKESRVGLAELKPAPRMS